MNVIPDPRHIANGHEIPTESYSDQPYIVQTDDGAWLCVMTTGGGREGEPGQHIVSLRSTDQGRSWSEPVDVEAADGPESSYAVLLKAPGGRVYCFYNYNEENRRWVRADEPPYEGGKCYRVDSQGSFVFKYSDDGGRSWSTEHTCIPIRNFEIDRQNPYGGEVQYFWNVGRAFIHDGAAHVPLHKVGGFGEGFMTSSQGVLLKSNNLLTEQEPGQATWETLPDGDIGLRTPAGGGPVSDEQSFCVLGDGSFYCVYRTIDGHPVDCYSRDGGHTWSEPQYKRYANGRLMKHPRAANFAWRCENGKYLYWFHNHGGRFLREHPQRRSVAYQERNPVWLSGGVEVDGPDGRVIQWSQPEIALYDDDPIIRMSYPDLVEEEGRYFVTETQKEVARVHELEPSLLQGMWNQFNEDAAVTREGLLLELIAEEEALPAQVSLPELPVFVQRSTERADHGTEDLHAGFSIELRLRLDSLVPGQIVLDNRTGDHTGGGQGFCLQTAARGTLEIVLNDGRTENRWACDPGLLTTDKLHHVVVAVDGGPRIITFVVDGLLCDGGDWRQFGWGRFSPHHRGPQGSDVLHIGPSLRGEVKIVRLYNRALRTSEAIGNFRVDKVGRRLPSNGDNEPWRDANSSTQPSCG